MILGFTRTAATGSRTEPGHPASRARVGTVATDQSRLRRDEDPTILGRFVPCRREGPPSETRQLM